jgi:hypothetical protein
MEERLSPAYRKQAQWLADLQEDLELVRYPTRVEMLRAVDEAANRADSLARLEDALQRLPRLTDEFAAGRRSKEETRRAEAAREHI